MKVRHLDGSGESDLKYLIEDPDRHGNVRIYFRRPGQRKIRMTEPLGSEEFFKEYRRAFQGQAAAAAPAQRVVKTRAIAGSMRWLIERYYAEDEEYGQLGDRTKHVRKQILDNICEESISDDDPRSFGQVDCRGIPPKMIRFLRDRKKGKPEAGNSRVKALRQVFKFGVKAGVDACTTNPAKEVPYIKTGSTGFHPWEPHEVRQFEATHAIGTRARLALALLLYLGPRRSDVVSFGKQHIRASEDMPDDLREIHPGPWLKYTQHKNRKRKPITLTIPVLPELEEVLAQSPVGNLTWLMTKLGAPFTANGFGNWFRDRCDEAGLHECAAHGLRKAGATIAAENGATAHQLMAIFGWRTMKEAQRYTETAERQRLAGSAMRKIIRRTK